MIFPDGKRIILLAEGRLVNLGCGTGHPSYVMSSLVRQPGDRADRAVHAARDKYPVGVYVLPKHLDEKVARLQLTKLGAKLTELRDEQAKYIGVRSRPARTSRTTTGTDAAALAAAGAARARLARRRRGVGARETVIRVPVGEILPRVTATSR